MAGEVLRFRSGRCKCDGWPRQIYLARLLRGDVSAPSGARRGHPAVVRLCVNMGRVPAPALNTQQALVMPRARYAQRAR